jgi:hypothetical protein
MTPDAVARIVEQRGEVAFTELLRAAAAELDRPEFEANMADAVRAAPQLNDLWHTWSGDQRWTPSAYLEGVEVGWFDDKRQHVRVHRDEAEAAADFIHRLAASLARGEVLMS